MFIMFSGEVEITKRLTLDLDEDTPKERVMIRLKAEDGVYFGEMTLLENDDRSATVTASSDCRLLELHQKDFLELIQHRSRHGGEAPDAPGPGFVPAICARPTRTW